MTTVYGGTRRRDGNGTSAEQRTSNGRSGGGCGGAAGLAALAGLAWVARDVPAALGGRLTGARAERAARSPQFRDGTFHNRAGTRTMPADAGPQPAPRADLRQAEAAAGRRPCRCCAPAPRPAADAAPTS